jgi:hypothetical protein
VNDPSKEETQTFMRLKRLHDLTSEAETEFSPEEAFPEVQITELWEWTDEMEHRGFIADEGTMPTYH